jgi:hypothetical protein
MNTKLLQSVLIPTVLLGASSALNAALEIDAGDITGGVYNYTLTDSMVASGDWEDDVSSFSNLHSSTFDSTRSSISMDAGATLGELIYLFDFTDAGYTIDSFSIVESWRREIDGPSYASRNSTGMTSYYSTNGTDWTELLDVAPATAYSSGADVDSGTITLSATDVSTLYFKVVLTSSPALSGTSGEAPALAGHTGINWNYSTREDFSATINVIPEPAAGALLLGGLALMGCLSVRRRR